MRLAVDAVQRALHLALERVHWNFLARATPRKLSRKQSATAAQSSVSGDQRSPGPSNSAGGAVTSVGRPAEDTGTSPSGRGGRLDRVDVRIRMHA